MRLRVYDKDKGYHLCIGTFYGDAEYLYVRRSWCILAPMLPYDCQCDDRLLYDFFCQEMDISVELTSTEFRQFINQYLADRDTWHPALEPYLIDTTHWKYKSLYKSTSNKILEWYTPDTNSFRRHG